MAGGGDRFVRSWLGVEFSAYSSLNVDSPTVLQVTNAWPLLSHPVALIGLELSV
jgi:hypothetical protein